MVKIINYLNGYVRIKVWGVSVERFMNLCGNKNLLIWDVHKSDNGYEMCISLQAFYELRPIVKKTSTRVVILERYGLPFLLPNLRKRIVFTVACLLTLVFLYGSSLFLLDIELDGNYRLTDEVLLDFFEDHNVRIGMLKNNLDIELLEKEIRRSFTEVTWASLKLEGTRLLVSLKENDAPIIESADLDEKDENGMDMVSSVNGRIVSMIVRKGVPQVSIGDEVEAGAILVEGKVPVMNEDGTVREYIYVEADADIYLQHTIAYENTLPHNYSEKRYTGREKRGFFIRWDKEEWKVERSNPYLLYDVVTKEYRPELFEKLKIPFYCGTFQYREYHYLEKKYLPEEVEALLEEDLLQFMKSLNEKGVQIIEKDVKISNNSDSWVSAGFITVIEQVNTKQPTVTDNITDGGE